MMNYITSLVALAFFLWSIITLAINFTVPHSLFFNYGELYAEDVCQYEAQAIKGNRWSRFNNPSAGVDEIFPVGVNIPADRFSWPDGYYQAGNSTSGWTEIISVPPGKYVWRNTQLRIDILHIFPLYLDEQERPESNVFTVYDCREEENISEAVSQAFEKYLEIEGYVVD